MSQFYDRGIIELNLYNNYIILLSTLDIRRLYQLTGVIIIIDA